MHALKLYLESRLLATFYRSELRSKCAQQTGVRNMVKFAMYYINIVYYVFVDVYNFDSKRYSSLPEVTAMSREERMQKRTRE